jgi:hypothetical protein
MYPVNQEHNWKNIYIDSSKSTPLITNLWVKDFFRVDFTTETVLKADIRKLSTQKGTTSGFLLVVPLVFSLLEIHSKFSIAELYWGRSWWLLLWALIHPWFTHEPREPSPWSPEEGICFYFLNI